MSEGKELGSCRACTEDRTELPECRLRPELGTSRYISFKAKRQKIEWWLPGTWGEGERELLINSTEFQLCKMKCFRDGWW